MSIKELLKDQFHWVAMAISAVSGAVAWMLARKKNVADTNKTSTETSGIALKNKIDEKKYEEERYEKLLKKMIEYEKHVEECDLKLQEMSKRLLEQNEKIQEFTARLTIYRTTK